MEIETGRESGVLVLSVVGRIDGTNSRAFQDDLRDRIQPGDTSMVVDLSRTDYVSSAGLRILLLQARATGRGGGRMVLCQPNSIVMEVLEMSGFDKAIGIYPDAASAASALAGKGN